MKQGISSTKFFTIKYVAKLLKVPDYVIWMIIESVRVKVDKDYESSAKLGDMMDIGLNLISLKTGSIVPDLIRCHSHEEWSEDYFPMIELAEEAVNIIKEYKESHPGIFKALRDAKRPRLFKVFFKKVII